MKEFLRKLFKIPPQEIKTFYTLRIERMENGMPDEREEEFKIKLLALANEYYDVPMFLLQNLRYSWERNTTEVMLHLPDPNEKSLRGYVHRCHFIGSGN